MSRFLRHCPRGQSDHIDLHCLDAQAVWMLMPLLPSLPSFPEDLIFTQLASRLRATAARVEETVPNHEDYRTLETIYATLG